SDGHLRRRRRWQERLPRRLLQRRDELGDDPAHQRWGRRPVLRQALSLILTKTSLPEGAMMRCLSRPSSFMALAPLLACANAPTPGLVGGSGGGGSGGGGGGGGNGGGHGGSGGMICEPGSTVSCYTGPAGTLGVGACKGGTQTCNAMGTGYG